jgi:hypothetical protein
MLFAPVGTKNGEPPHVMLVQGKAEVDDSYRLLIAVTNYIIPVHLDRWCCCRHGSTRTRARVIGLSLEFTGSRSKLSLS